MPTIEVLDPNETRAALTGSVRRNETLTELSDRLMSIANSGGSLFVMDLDEPLINSLRVKMQRRSLRLSARKVNRNGQLGHILMVESVA